MDRVAELKSSDARTRGLSPTRGTTLLFHGHSRGTLHLPAPGRPSARSRKDTFSTDLLKIRRPSLLRRYALTLPYQGLLMERV